jgi:hypothetical protein
LVLQLDSTHTWEPLQVEVPLANLPVQSLSPQQPVDGTHK